ncbi:MAG: hypothetical protein L0Z47_10145, partial [Actinobacteria bacterium]|nr:hypothetical protein [Actinomycetota bacterium]
MDVAPILNRLSCRHPDPHLDRVGHHLVLEVQSEGNRPTGRVEGDERPVSKVLDHLTAVRRAQACYQILDFPERATPRDISLAVEELVDGSWRHWPLTFPENDDVPG